MTPRDETKADEQARPPEGQPEQPQPPRPAGKPTVGVQPLTDDDIPDAAR